MKYRKVRGWETAKAVTEESFLKNEIGDLKHLMNVSR